MRIIRNKIKNLENQFDYMSEILIIDAIYLITYKKHRVEKNDLHKCFIN